MIPVFWCCVWWFAENVARKGRLRPGQMFVVSFEEQRTYLGSYPLLVLHQLKLLILQVGSF
eukprot:COSAG05_NODE_2217_length_3376_cov_61.717410_6_plen_61_part_00